MKHFGLRILQTLLGFSALALILACSREPDTAQAKGDIKTRIPVASENGSYSFQEVELTGISSLYEFAGKYANFYIYPQVSDKKIVGHRPKTRFTKSGSLYIPQDELTLQMTVIYAQFQKLAALDKEVGVEEGLNKWPRDVGIAVRYKSNNSVELNNVFYDGNTDAVLVVPYTFQNTLPLAVNTGVLAHEHFHSLYYKIVDKKVSGQARPSHGQDLIGKTLENERPISKVSDDETSDFRSDYHNELSRGLNEGLADFWAWVYTGDPDFLAASLPEMRKSRSLRLSEAQAEAYVFPNSRLWDLRMRSRYRNDISDDLYGNNLKYWLGSEYARTLKRFTAKVEKAREVTSIEARKIVAAGVVKALYGLGPALKAMQDKDAGYLEPVEFFAILQKSMTSLKTEESQFLTDLVNKSKAVKKGSPTPIEKGPTGTATIEPIGEKP